MPIEQDLNCKLQLSLPTEPHIDVLSDLSISVHQEYLSRYMYFFSDNRPQTSFFISNFQIQM